MRAKHCVFGLGLVLASSATSLTALADGPAAAGAAAEYPSCAGRQVTPEESDAAHKKYTAGKVDYDEANYDAAIARFRDSYAKDCTKHEILVIISRAYEQKGDRAEAVRALEAYLQRVPNSPERSTYESRIAKLKELIEKERQKAAAAAPGAGAADNGDKSGGHTIYPWLVVGLGGAAVIAGIVVIVTTPDLPAGCDLGTKRCEPLPGDKPGDLEERQDTAGAHRGQPVVGAIISGAGAALVLGGLLWHFLEPTGSSSASTKTKLTPTAAPGYAGLSLGGTF